MTGRKGEGARETKHRFFAKISKTDKHLQREDKHSTPGIKEGVITTDLTAQKGNKEAHEQLLTADPAAPRRRINSWGDTNYRNSLKK